MRARQFTTAVFLLAILSVSGLSTSTVGAWQEATVRLNAEPTCDTCHINIQRIAVLGDETDPAVVREGIPRVHRSGNGNYYAILQGGTEIGVYDDSGRLIKRLGGAGPGPGEYAIIVSFERGADDQLMVFDYLRRASVYDARDELASSLRLPVGPLDAVRLDDGSLVLAGMLYTAQRIGFPLQHVSLRGELIKSFGASNEAVVDPDRPSADQRVITRASPTSVWASRPDRYEIEEWDVERGLIRRIVASALWFPSREHEMGPLDGPPDSWIMDLRADQDGRIWVLGTTADPRWAESGYVRAEGEPMGPIVMDSLYDSVIEVLVPDEGTLIASLRVPARFVGFAGPNLLFRLAEAPEGEVQAEIWRVELVVGS